jgi:invasion protein IalB
MLLGTPHLGRAEEGMGPLWHKSCGKGADGQQSCVVEQFAIAMPQKTVLLHISFSTAGSPDQARMMLTAPLGVLLAPGLTLSVDGSKPIVLPFERCTGQGCEASAALDKSALDEFSRGKTLMVRYAVSETKSADVPIRLQGFAVAFKSLSR